MKLALTLMMTLSSLNLYAAAGDKYPSGAHNSHKLRDQFDKFDDDGAKALERWAEMYATRDCRAAGNKVCVILPDETKIVECNTVRINNASVGVYYCEAAATAMALE